MFLLAAQAVAALVIAEGPVVLALVIARFSEGKTEVNRRIARQIGRLQRPVHGGDLGGLEAKRLEVGRNRYGSAGALG
jgi:hypothetical protein